QSALSFHSLEETRAGIGRLNMERGGSDPMLDGPIDRSPKHIRPIFVHAEDEAAVDHDAQAMKAIGDGFVIAPEILSLVALGEVAGQEGFEADEDAAKP